MTSHHRFVPHLHVASRRIPLLLLASATLALLAACAATTPQVGTENEILTRFAAGGPFATTSSAYANCTFFWPDPTTSEVKSPLPVILWGNGTFQYVSTYQPLLTHLASHGFLVAAANTTDSGDGSQMLDCLTYLETENARPESAFFGRVLVGRVGASGHSQGGAGTLMAGRDPRVTATAPIQPYVLPISNGGAFSYASISQQRGPMLLLSGASDTTASPKEHQLPILRDTNTSVVWANLAGGSHLEPFGDAGRYRGVLTAWFLAKLADQPEALPLFPPECTLCSAPGWRVELK